MNATPGTRPAARRLFFAYWPDELARARLAAATRPAVTAAGGDPVAAANLHVTVAFLGAVLPGAVAGLLEAGEACRQPAAEFRFNRLECWSRPGILALLPDPVPAAATALAARLHGLLGPLGFEIDSQPWRPHLTIARRVRALPAGMNALEVRWLAEELALVESSRDDGGLHYRPIARWALGPQAR